MSKDIAHINPNCIDAKYCEPHSENGEVYYSSASVRKLITVSNQKYLREFAKNKVRDGSWIKVRDGSWIKVRDGSWIFEEVEQFIKEKESEGNEIK